MFGVKTLDKNSFVKDCMRLQDCVIRDGFDPDVILSIATGGVYVAEQMFNGVPHYSVRLQRRSTAHKKSWMSRILHHMPRPILDLMRRVEAVLLKCNHVVPKRLDHIPSLGDAGYILIVDDAVDSGATLAAVREAVIAAYPDAKVCTAVITVTTSTPMVYPDYGLYDKILIRFPWSMDA